MMKDSFFNPSRFGRVLVKELKENRRTLLLRMVALYVVLAGMLTWNGYLTCERYVRIAHDGGAFVDPMWNEVRVFFFFALFLAGAALASQTFSNLRDKAGRLSALMLPAADFEKFAARWVICCILGLIVLLLTFWLADLTRVAVCVGFYPDAEVPILFFNPFAEEALFPAPEAAWLTAAGLFFVQSFFVLGSAVWPRNALAITLGVGAALVAAYVLVLGWLLRIFESLGGGNVLFYVRQEPSFWILVSGCFLFGIVNLVIAYYRFKEWEIVPRM